jgi:hypothetical protein
LVFLSATGERSMRRVYAALARIEDEFAAEVGPRRFATFKKVMVELSQPG